MLPKFIQVIQVVPKIRTMIINACQETALQFGRYEWARHV